MAVYYKPQSPIQSGEDFIYPITTADQVMVDEDTRLNAVGVYLKNIDNSTDTTVYGNNATTLGGVAAEDYALKTDTAPDSSKLGGKAPEYYTNPRNLLDNSDFTRFIARAGIMGTYGAVPYAGDRWRMNGGTVTGVANAYGDGYTDITFQTNSRIEQIVTGIDKYYGQPMTAAVWLKNGSAIVGSAIVNAPTEDYLTPISAGVDNLNIYLQATTGDERKYLFIITTYENSKTISAAALLPGSYTAETLPSYIPKGYAAELAACNSAPVDLGGGYGGGSLQAYPVGSIYMSVNSTSPASLFGGTWEQLKDRFLLGAGDSYTAGNTSGSATHQHSYGFQYGAYYGSLGLESSNANTAGLLTYDGNNNIALTGYSTSSQGGKEARINNAATTSGKVVSMTHHRMVANTSNISNMPPYLVVYMWKRMA